MARVSVSTVVHAPQAEVWALISDVTRATRWNKAWTGIELTSNQSHGAGTRFRTRTESGETYEFEVSEWSAPERLTIRPVRDIAEPTYPVTLEAHQFILKPGPEVDTTLVELRAHASTRGIRGYLIGNLFWPGHQKEGLQVALEAVSANFDSGAEPTGGPDPLSS